MGRRIEGQVRRSPVGLSFLGILMVGALLLTTSCGALNPGLLDAVGLTSPLSTLESPEGYVLVALLNRTPTSVGATIDVVKENQTTRTWRLGAGALDYFVFAQECDLESIQVTNFSYRSVGQTVEESPNLGILMVGESLFCGDVVAITIDGTPPNIEFSVEIF